MIDQRNQVRLLKICTIFYREQNQMLTFITCKFQSPDSNNHISSTEAMNQNTISF